MMDIKNFELFPNNIFTPEKIRVDSSEYKLFTARFDNLYDLYHYLTSNPKINRHVFFGPLASETGSYSFAGKPYNDAVEDLLKDHDPGYTEFLQLQSDINESLGGPQKRYVSTRKVVGSHIFLPAYSAGTAKCYISLDKVNRTKFIRMHFGLSYSWGTSKSQVFNRALITTNLIKALENKGYTVDLHAFELSEEYDEVINIILKLKRFDGTLDMDALYKSSCNVEFLRRILFRVMETMDIRNSWNQGYGMTCSERFARKILKLDKNDIFIDEPSDLGIYGDNLAEDFENTIEHLDIKDKIDVDRAVSNMRRQAKILKR